MGASTKNNSDDAFTDAVSKKEQRKLKAIRDKKGSALYGLGMFGMVGWSVAAPCLLGAALGSWLDKRYPQPFSWVLTCLVAGLFTGCAVAWYWIAKENKEMHQNDNE